MTQEALRPSEAQLHAYVDGYLASHEVPAVERYLAANPSEALRLEAYRKLNDGLQALRAAPEQHPFHLREFRPLIAWRTVLVRAAAAALLLAVGGGSGWWLNGRLQPKEPAWLRLVQQAERAHVTYVPEVLHPVEVTSEQAPHLQTWLSRRLGMPVLAPALTGDGYRMVGGRLLPGAAGPAALIMYQDGSGQRLTLYLAAADGKVRESSMRYLQSGNLWICYWVGKRVEFAVTGELEPDRIKAIAEEVYRQLEKISPGGSDSW